MYQGTQRRRCSQRVVYVQLRIWRMMKFWRLESLDGVGKAYQAHVQVVWIQCDLMGMAVAVEMLWEKVIET
jgi:hypothetical protein